MLEKERQTTDLTEEEKRSLEYLNYPTKPIVLPAGEAVASGAIRKDGEDIIIRFDKSEAGINTKEEVTVSPDHQYSLIEATTFGLDEATVRAEKGTILRDAFMEDFGVVMQKMEETGEDPFDFGTWVYYPRGKDVFHYASEYWHRLSLCMTNSTLLLDPEKKLSFQEAREKLANSVVASIGLSVGNNAAQSVIKDLRPKNYIVADPALYKLTNANRVLSLRSKDMVLSEDEKEQIINLHGLRPKWQVFAEQIHALDPFMDIFCYPEANESNLSQLIGGNRVQPKADVVIEICDTNGVKLAAAEEARRQKVPFIRLTDAGSKVSLDIRRFDLVESLPISLGVDDQELHRLSDLAENSSDDFIRFATALVGNLLDYDDEFGKLVKGGLPRVSSSLPQLGSTAVTAGGWTGEIVGRILLGHKFPERVVLDLHNLTIETRGEVM